MTEERKYWNPEIETMPLDKLKKLQEERLQTVVTRAYEKTAFYRRKFDEAEVKPADIKTVDDIKKLPLVHSLEDFRKAPIFDRLAVPYEEVKYVESTSGTTGIPMAVLWSTRDWDAVMDLEPRARWTLGARPEDTVHLLTGFPCCQRGYQELGARVLALSAGRGNLDNQIRLGQMVGVTVIEQLPSLALKYFERAEELGIDIREMGLRLVISAGETWAESYKKKIESRYGVRFASMYGSVDLCLVALECEEDNGMHILSDLCAVEVIDPETEEILGPGEEGELVVTLLWNEATPIIRYRSGDIATLLPYEPCPCGRTLPKMSAVRGRLVHSIKVRGKRVFPLDVEEVVANISELGDDYQIVVDKPGELDRLKVRVEHSPEVKNLKALQEKVEKALSQYLGVDSEVELVPPGTIGRALFKAQRFVTAY